MYDLIPFFNSHTRPRLNNTLTKENLLKKNILIKKVLIKMNVYTNGFSLVQFSLCFDEVYVQIVNYMVVSLSLTQSRKTPRGFIFPIYWSLNNWNNLLESGDTLKQQWSKTTNNGMLKLTNTKVLWKYLSSTASTACFFEPLIKN